MLKSISLQNFRSHKKSSFEFSETVTFIVGPNTSGKTNLLEAIGFLSTGKSVRGAKDEEVIRFGENIARVKARLQTPERSDGGQGQVSDTELEVVITSENPQSSFRPGRKYLVNGVSKSRINFAGNISTVHFSPSDLDIISGSPGLRRELLDDVLEQADRDYRSATSAYTKALRQRNALLDSARESGVRNEKQFDYWDNLLINTGSVITAKRQEFIDFLNSSIKEVFDFVATYDKSLISKQRLQQYREAEIASTVTLVGPHRDDFFIQMFNDEVGAAQDIKVFGSRGQQRLVILQLKLLQLSFMEKVLGERPLLLLDDIFSELDEAHIKLVTEMIGNQQSIVTTTHEEFLDKKLLKQSSVIELNNGKKS